MKGRPVVKLNAASERTLRARARRVERLEQQLEEARTALAVAAAVAVETEGASLRTVGVAINRRPSTVHALLHTHITKGKS